MAAETESASAVFADHIRPHHESRLVLVGLDVLVSFGPLHACQAIAHLDQTGFGHEDRGWNLPYAIIASHTAHVEITHSSTDLEWFDAPGGCIGESPLEILAEDVVHRRRHRSPSPAANPVLHEARCRDRLIRHLYPVMRASRFRCFIRVVDLTGAVLRSLAMSLLHDIGLNQNRVSTVTESSLGSRNARATRFDGLTLQLIGNSLTAMPWRETHGPRARGWADAATEKNLVMSAAKLPFEATDQKSGSQ